MVTSDGWAEANLPALSSGLTQNRGFRGRGNARTSTGFEAVDWDLTVEAFRSRKDICRIPCRLLICPILDTPSAISTWQISIWARTKGGGVHCVAASIAPLTQPPQQHARRDPH